MPPAPTSSRTSNRSGRGPSFPARPAPWCGGSGEKVRRSCCCTARAARGPTGSETCCPWPHDLGVFRQMESVRRARFRSEGIPESDSLLKALPAIRARVTSIRGSRDAFMGPHLEDCRRILAPAHRDSDFRVIEGVGHWTPYEAADQVNAILIDMLR